MLGERIRQLRTMHNISQVELAKHLCVTKQSVSNWENENIQPSIDMLVKISSYFRVSTDYLIGLNDRRYLDVTGLNNHQITHIQQIIDDIRNTK